MGRERGMLRGGTVGLHGSNISPPALDANAIVTLDSNLEADFEYLDHDRSDLASITIPDPRSPRIGSPGPFLF